MINQFDKLVLFIFYFSSPFSFSMFSNTHNFPRTQFVSAVAISTDRPVQVFGR